MGNFQTTMKTITTNKLQSELSSVIKDVQSGEVYQVNRYSETAAYLISAEKYESLVGKTECKACINDLRKIANKIEK